jgi:hypothetical protein
MLPEVKGRDPDLVLAEEIKAWREKKLAERAAAATEDRTPAR